jgi:HK97 family phage major capsid protein
MNWREMLEKASALVGQAQKLLEEAGDKITAEQKAQVDQWLKEAEDLSKKADELRGNDDRSERMKTLHAAISAKAGRQGRPAAGAPASGFKSWAEFLKAVYRGNDPRLQMVDSVLTSEERKDLAEGALSTGGALVPAEFRSDLLEAAAESAIVRPRAFSIPMGSRSVTIPMLDQTQIPAACETAFFGGVALEWIEEAEDKPDTEPAFKQLELVAHELAGWLPASNALIADSAVTIGALIPRLFGAAAAWAEDYAFFRGDGVGKPLGVLNAPATIWHNRASASMFTFADAVGMLAHLLPQSWARAVWSFNISVLPQLYQMTDDNDNNIWLPNASEKGPGTLLGIPITFTEKLPVLGTKGDIMLCDFSFYIVGDREMPAVASSVHERFRKNQTTWRISERLDGQPWLPGRITLADGETEVSPFVGLTDAT